MAKPRQARLPGTENPKIEALHGAAEEYAEIRDRRQELTKEESALKQSLLATMKKHHKTVYKYNGVEVRVIAENEKVKVRITKPQVDDV